MADSSRKSILKGTSPRLDVDFGSKTHQGEGPIDIIVSDDVVINCAIKSQIQRFCIENSISPEAFALWVFHRILRAYSHQAFAIGVYHKENKGGNILLVPFEGNTSGGSESFCALHDRWTNDILPHCVTPYEKVKDLGYGCNVTLSFHGSRSSNNNFERIDEEMDLHVSWMENDSNDGSIPISFESGIGRWPDIEERFKYIISQILTASSNEKNAAALTSSSSLISIDNLLPRERNQVLALATGPKDPIIDCCLHELVENQARLRPNAAALMNKCGTETMTYGELDARAHRLAVELQQRGARPNTYVGILMGEKTFEMYVAVLGVLKAGAAYVPMDAVLFSRKRIKFIVEDTDMKLLVTVGEHAGLGLIEGDVGFDEVLAEEAVMNVDYDDVRLDRVVKPSDCAYMIYTSGTTGVPKGVVDPMNTTLYESGIEFFSKGVPEDDVVGCSAPYHISSIC